MNTERKMITASLLKDRRFILEKIAGMNVEYTGHEKALKESTDEIKKIDDILSDGIDPIIDIVDIKPTENQVVVMRFKEHISDVRAKEINDMVKERFPGMGPVLVLENGASMAIANVPAEGVE